MPNSEHSEDCIHNKCLVCKEGPEAAESWEIDTFGRLGYYVHYVPLPECINAHTHGFDISWDHLDFQIVLPLPPKIVSQILDTFANRVKDGERFEPDTQIEGGSQFGCKLAAATECGRPILRIVFPDSTGKFPGDDDVAEGFADQLVWDTDAL
jgi:hypothetical protein